MALVVGDIHGRINKAKAFLAYKPEEKHIFSGDYVDSFVQSDHVIYETLKLVIESPAILVLGNHDIHYLDHAPFKCSGYRQYMAESIGSILEAYIDRFVPVAVEDGFVITHGGVSNGLNDSLLCNGKLNSIWTRVYSEWDTFIRTRGRKGCYNYSDNNSVIFNISKYRGGIHKFGGIFWADYRDEGYCGVPQIFGHSKTPNGIMQVNPNHWALGCDDNKFECFNTKTHEVEDFSGEPTSDSA